MSNYDVMVAILLVVVAAVVTVLVLELLDSTGEGEE